MIFGIKEKLIILTQCIVGYCYKYTCATYDWFCAPGPHLSVYWTDSFKGVICLWIRLHLLPCMFIFVHNTRERYLYHFCIAQSASLNTFSSDLITCCFAIDSLSYPHRWKNRHSTTSNGMNLMRIICFWYFLLHTS